MVKMTTLCRRLDTPRLSLTLFALAMLATAFINLESQGQETPSESRRSYSVLLNPPLSTTNSDSENPDSKTEIQQEEDGHLGMAGRWEDAQWRPLSLVSLDKECECEERKISTRKSVQENPKERFREAESWRPAMACERKCRSADG